MIANGVSVTFDFAFILAVFGIVIGGYAALWALPRIKSLFFGK
jgi:hypothetical protein